MGISRHNTFSLFINWIPALLALAVIAMESTATMSGENTSRWLLPLWIKFFGPVSGARWEEIHFLIRKSGHFVGYGLVSLAFYRGWRKSLQGSPRQSAWYRRLRAAGFAVFCTLLVASADEYHQSFLSGRTSSPYDVCLDVCGALVAHLMLFATLRFLWRGSIFQSTPDRRGWA
jgi:VanZ family protein